MDPVGFIPNSSQLVTRNRQSAGIETGPKPLLFVTLPEMHSGRFMYLFQPSQSKMWVEILFGPLGHAFPFRRKRERSSAQCNNPLIEKERGARVRCNLDIEKNP
jgi:hypothetical protein